MRWSDRWSRDAQTAPQPTEVSGGAVVRGIRAASLFGRGLDATDYSYIAMKRPITPPARSLSMASGMSACVMRFIGGFSLPVFMSS